LLAARDHSSGRRCRCLLVAAHEINAGKPGALQPALPPTASSALPRGRRPDNSSRLTREACTAVGPRARAAGPCGRSGVPQALPQKAAAWSPLGWVHRRAAVRGWVRGRGRDHTSIGAGADAQSRGKRGGVVRAPQCGVGQQCRGSPVRVTQVQRARGARFGHMHGQEAAPRTTGGSTLGRWGGAKEGGRACTQEAKLVPPPTKPSRGGGRRRAGAGGQGLSFMRTAGKLSLRAAGRIRTGEGRRAWQGRTGRAKAWGEG
jgi:hypothetical protein